MRLGQSLLGIALLTGFAAQAQQSPAPSFKYTSAGLYGGFGGYVTPGFTNYFQGRNKRSEFHGSAYADITNYDLHYRFDLDMAAKVYTATRIDDSGLPVYPPPARVEGKPWKPSGRTVHIHVQTVDTGERRKMFGYTARRVITRWTTTISPPGDAKRTTTETDGWYIDPPAWIQSPQPRAQTVVYGSIEGPRDDLQVTREGPVETGLPIARRTGPDYQRAIEISERPLDPALFRPPADFKRVTELPHEPTDVQYPFSLRLQMHWLLLTDGL
ncbi:MAG: hypothetical protein ACLP59_12000 [Bryobacteraceae bacterium]